MYLHIVVIFFFVSFSVSLFSYLSERTQILHFNTNAIVCNFSTCWSYVDIVIIIISIIIVIVASTWLLNPCNSRLHSAMQCIWFMCIGYTLHIEKNVNAFSYTVNWSNRTISTGNHQQHPMSISQSVYLIAKRNVLWPLAVVVHF